MDFDWDEAKAQRNLSKHGVSFEEAGTVFGDALSWTYPDPFHSDSEQRWITVGLSEELRLLVVVHVDSEHGPRLISARQATPRERRFYEQS